jgi:hypothetical protein
MLTPDSLFLLIKSLTKAEKRSFKLFITHYQASGDKVSLLLFNAIDSMEDYNESSVKKKLSKGLPTIEKLGNAKSYLYKQILKNLKNSISDDSSEVKLNNYLLEINILYKKELFKDCLDKIVKAKALAGKYDMLAKLIELDECEINVAWHLNDVGQIKSLRNKAPAEEDVFIEKLQELIALNSIARVWKAHTVEHGNGNSVLNEEFVARLMGHGVMQQPAKSFNAESKRLSLIGQLMTMTNNLAQKKAATYDFINHFERNVHQLGQNVNWYFSAMVSLSSPMIAEKKYIAAERLHTKMKSLYKKHEYDLKSLHRMSFLQFEIFLLLNQGEFALAFAKIPVFKAFAAESRLCQNPVAELFMLEWFSIICFTNQRFNDLQHYLG